MFDLLGEIGVCPYLWGSAAAARSGSRVSALLAQLVAGVCNGTNGFPADCSSIFPAALQLLTLCCFRWQKLAFTRAALARTVFRSLFQFKRAQSLSLRWRRLVSVMVSSSSKVVSAPAGNKPCCTSASCDHMAITQG